MIILNAFFGIAVLGAGQVVIAIHSTHSLSVYSELVTRGVIAKDAETRVMVVPGDSLTPSGHYDVCKRLETIGAVESYVTFLSVMAFLFFIVNALVWAKAHIISPPLQTPTGA